jgi:adenosylmethionine-8-amino-7-oxononanoate aminotransferase
MGAMSVCDPLTGMHSLFNSVISQQFFVERPHCRFGESCNDSDLQPLEQLLQQNHRQSAALNLEPVVQGAGGMHFYAADYVARARALCDRYKVLLIADEIATGFGRSGKMFACEHAGVAPDIMCVGKALTGGYMSLAATLTTAEISNTIDQGHPGVFMHGPTFMANPLACAVAVASIEMLIESDWEHRISQIELQLKHLLSPCAELPQVAEVRCLGAIGVIEMKQAVDMASIMRQFVDAGIWVRPFGKLVYLMPAYVITAQELEQLCTALIDVVARQSS